jgi:hypothetical protein
MVQLFGTTISETLEAFKGTQLGPRKKPPSSVRPGDKSKALGRLIVSLLLTLTATFLIAANQGQSQTVGAAILGSVAGYWLK